MPDILRFEDARRDQPRPQDTLYDYFPPESPSGTAISRRWREGDAQRCSLCRVCSRVGDFCLVLVHNRVIPPHECAMWGQGGPRAAPGGLTATS